VSEQETKPCNAKKPQPTKLARGEQEPEAHCTQTSKGLFLFFFGITISYCDHKEYMYRALSTVIMGEREGWAGDKALQC
jgi:hypothetical protein